MNALLLAHECHVFSSPAVTSLSCTEAGRVIVYQETIMSVLFQL